MTKMTVFVIVMVLVAIAPAIGQQPSPLRASIQTLYQECKSESRVAQDECMSYLEGVADHMKLIGGFQLTYGEKMKQLGLTLAPFATCGDFTAGALRQAFINWAERNPARWQSDEYEGALETIQGTWPCE